MTIKVLQVNNVKFFKRWHWWSMWEDISVFDYESTPFLIQMCVSRTNAKKFKAIRITGKYYKQATCKDIGDLLPMDYERTNRL